MAIQFLLIPIAAAFWSACSDNTANNDGSDAAIDKDPGNSTLDIPHIEVHPRDSYEEDATIGPETDEADFGPVPDGENDAAIQDAHDGDSAIADAHDAPDASDVADLPEALPEPDLPDVAPLPETCEPEIAAPSCDVIDMSAGQSATCFVMQDGSVRCSGELRPITGDPEDVFFKNPLPQEIPGFVNITQISLALRHLMARDGNGQIWALGENMHGQLCDGTQLDRYDPAETLFPGNMIEAQAGSFHTIGRHASGTAYACGDNSRGQLGIKKLFSNDPVAGMLTVPGVVAFPNQSVMSALDLGHFHSVAINDSGAALGWGLNYLIEDCIPGVEDSDCDPGTATKLGTPSQLGLPDATDEVFSPLLIEKSGVLGAAAGIDFTLLMSETCTVSAVGSGERGQLGQGTGESSSEFAVISSLNDVTQIAAGGQQACAIDASGKLYCWGAMDLGVDDKGTPDDTTDDVVVEQVLLEPTEVTGLGTVSRVSVGVNHICAMNTSCEVYCWGANDFGQLAVVGIPYSVDPVSVNF